MIFYLKVIAFTACILMYLGLGILSWNSFSKTADEKTFALFKESQYTKALAYASELEKNSRVCPLYPLYQAYILREEGEIEESTAALKKALKRALVKKNRELLAEIYLNLSLNGYLTHNFALLQESMAPLKEIYHSNESLFKAKSQYFDLFRGIEAFFNKDYQKALVYFKKHTTFVAFSDWMALSFKKTFTATWIDSQIVRCFIEDAQFKEADEVLNEMAYSDELLFLRAFKLFKEAATVANKSPLHAAALLEISKINNKELIVNELTDYLHEQIIHFAKDDNLDNIPLYLNSLTSFSFPESLEPLSSDLAFEIDVKLSHEKKRLAFTLLQKIEGPCRVKLLYKVYSLMDGLIQKDFAKFQAYFDLMEPLKYSHEFDPMHFTGKIADRALILLNPKEKNVPLAISYLKFFDRHEERANLRFEISKKLINSAMSLWSQQDYVAALKIFKIAKAIPLEEGAPEILNILKGALSLLYKRAESHNLTEQHFYLLQAVKYLNLKGINLYDKQQKKQMLDDAAYFFSKGHYSIAYEKAYFILELEPDNQKANQIIGLIAYEKGHYEKALHHLEKIKKPDASTLKVLKLIQPLQPKL